MQTYKFSHSHVNISIFLPLHMQQTKLKSTNLSFDNTEIAFRGKTDADLKRAYWLFKMISINFLTKIGPPITNFALNIGLPITSLIKNTIFQHFCGGESIDECEQTVSQLHAGNVGSILDYSVEGEDDEMVFDATCEEIKNTIRHANGDERIPLTVFKVTGLGRFGLLEKLDKKQLLNEDEKAEFIRFKNRLDQIGSLSHDLGVKAIVYNTYQLYRNDKLASLKADVKTASIEHFFLGAKLVRGAYMEKERKRAIEFNYPSPIHKDKESTDQDYDLALNYCISKIEIVSFIAGTHNEESCRVLAELLDEKGIPHNHEHVYFSQLLGMSDNLSFNLSSVGYNVTKYVPYGPVKAVMPYLFRRAEENTSVAGQMGRELSLIALEKKRRKLK